MYIYLVLSWKLPKFLVDWSNRSEWGPFQCREVEELICKSLPRNVKHIIIIENIHVTQNSRNYVIIIIMPCNAETCTNTEYRVHWENSEHEIKAKKRLVAVLWLAGLPETGRSLSPDFRDERERWRPKLRQTSWSWRSNGSLNLVAPIGPDYQDPWNSWTQSNIIW